MLAKDQRRFDRQYQQHLTALKLNDLADSTIDVYARAVRRVAVTTQVGWPIAPAEGMSLYTSI